MLRPALVLVVSLAGLAAPGLAHALARPGVVQLAGKAGCVSPGGADGCAAGRAANVAFVAVSPDGAHVYAAGGLARESQVSAYRRAASGRLTEVAGTRGCLRGGTGRGCAQWRALETPTAIAVSPDGRNVYVSAENSYAVAILRRNPSTGGIVQTGCVSRGGNGGACSRARALFRPTGLAISPDGAHVYVASGEGIVALARDGATGALTQLPGQAGCVYGPASRGCGFADRSASFDAVAVTPDGAHVLAAAFDTVTVFGRDATTGALTPVSCVSSSNPACSPAPVLRAVRALAISPDGTSVYAATARGLLNDRGRGLVLLALDQATGAIGTPGTLGCISGSGTGGACTSLDGVGESRGVAVRPDGEVLALGSTLARRGRLVTFARAPGGALANPFRAPCLRDGAECRHARGLGVSVGLAYSPDGRHLYVAGGGLAVFRHT